jgi:hypothetical protein
MFFYGTSIWVVGGIANGLSTLMAKIGSPELWKMLHEHLFVRALMVGLIAGLVPLRIWIAAAGIFNRKFERGLKRINPDLLKPWVFMFLSPVIVIAFLRWTFQWFENGSQYSSVLQTTSPYQLSEFFKGFFSTNCSNASESNVFWRDGYGLSCMVHVQLIVIWMIAIGYSLAPAVRKKAMILFNTDNSVPMDEPSTANIQESTITEKTDIR